MEKEDNYRVQEADLVVGIPSYNEADNISFVVEQCNKGLLKYFKDYKSVIINVDNNSPDNTRSAFLDSVNTIPKIYITTDPGVKGKGNNFFNLFTEAARLKAKAVIVVDADITSITPEWVKSLASPILDQDYHYVTPLYSRHEYDGTITNNICYPLLYGLLGKNIRQPIGGDFAFSGDLAQHYLSQTWHDTTYQYGIDIFMTLNALLAKFPSCQTGLGAKCHKPSAPKLGQMFIQVVGTLFRTLQNSKKDWLFQDLVEDLPILGGAHSASPQELSIDYKSIRMTALKEYHYYKKDLPKYLADGLMLKIKRMFESENIIIHSELWLQIVFDFLFAFEKNGFDTRVVEALKPLYFGRVITFIKETLDLDHFKSEEKIKEQAELFYIHRNYLIDRYKN